MDVKNEISDFYSLIIGTYVVLVNFFNFRPPPHPKGHDFQLREGVKWMWEIQSVTLTTC